MHTFIEIRDFHAPELDIYARLTETQLRSHHGIENSLFIAESPHVIERALDAGCEPESLLMLPKMLDGREKGQEILARCGDVPVYVAEEDCLKQLTGFPLTRGVLCAMKRPPLPSAEELLSEGFFNLKDHPIKGNWASKMFGRKPGAEIVLELGCGHGEYTVGLAARYPGKNFLGIDIKGARMWSGAKQAKALGLQNAAFLRINIEMLPYFFFPDEIAEIWKRRPGKSAMKWGETNKWLFAPRTCTLKRRIRASKQPAFMIEALGS